MSDELISGGVTPPTDTQDSTQDNSADSSEIVAPDMPMIESENDLDNSAISTPTLENDPLAQDMPEIEPYLKPLTLFFVETYNEFAGLAAENEPAILRMFDKIACIYPQFKEAYNIENPSKECSKNYPFFMLVAHYLVVNGYGEKIGISRGNGLVASSSIDGVSVSYQAMPFNNNFQYFFNQTPYGQEYLAYLNTRTGLMLVNNTKDFRKW